MRNAGIKGVVEPSRLERSVGDADGDGVDVSDWIAIFLIVLMCVGAVRSFLLVGLAKGHGVNGISTTTGGDGEDTDGQC